MAVEFNRVVIVPSSVWWLLPLAAVIAAGVWWWRALPVLRGLQLLLTLTGTALLASGFGPHTALADHMRVEYPRALRRWWAWVTNAANFSATAYYPLPFYAGLVLLAAAAVLGVWPDRP
jgi:hypothetical protein